MNLATIPPRLRPVLAALCVFAAVFALFFPACFFQFVNWDDGNNIYHNPYYPPADAGAVAQFWIKPFNELFTPVTNTLWAGCTAFAHTAPYPVLGGGVSALSPLPFHALGVLMHAATAAVVFFLLRRLTQSDSGALLGALLWACHPLQVESVAWTTGHNNVYCGFFGALALLAYVRAAQSENGSRLDITVATGCYLLALLAKPTGVALPLVVAALELFVLRRPAKSWLPLVIGWATVAIALAVFTRAASSGSEGITVALWKRPVIALDAVSFYLGKIAFPAALGVDYGRLPDRVAFHWWGYANAFLTLAVTGVSFVLYQRGTRVPLAALALLVAAVFPMLGLVPYYFLRVSTVADRYVYLGLLGVAYALAATIAAAPPPRRRLALAIAGAAVAGYAVRTAFALPVWQNSLTLFAHAARINPESALAHSNLGLALEDKHRYDAAIAHTQTSVALEPRNSDYWNNLGVAYGERGAPGDTATALSAFRTAARLKPGSVEAHYHLGITLVDAGDPRGAVPELQEAVRLSPTFATAWFRLGVTLGTVGRASEAIQALSQTLALTPGDAEARYIRAVLLANGNQYAAAEADFAAVTKQTPRYAEAWYGLGKAQARLGKPAEARAALRECLRLAPANAKAKTLLAQLDASVPANPLSPP